MEEFITQEEAKQHQEITILLDEFVQLKSRNIIELIDSWEYKLCYKHISNTIYDNCSVLPYFVNNVASVAWSPKWIGTFACDLCYFYANLWKDKQLIEDMIWFLIDELWYYDYLDEWKNLLYVEWITLDTKLELFYNRLHNWLVKPLWNYYMDTIISRYMSNI